MLTSFTLMLRSPSICSALTIGVFLSMCVCVCLVGCGRGRGRSSWQERALFIVEIVINKQANKQTYKNKNKKLKLPCE